MVVSAGEEANEDTAPSRETYIVVGANINSTVRDDVVSVITPISILHWVRTVSRKRITRAAQELVCGDLLKERVLACG
jgi:hypothetical protein